MANIQRWHWAMTNNYGVRYYGENGEITEFGYFGTCEEIKDVLKEISHFKQNQDYHFFPDSETIGSDKEVTLDQLIKEWGLKWNRYVIHNQELKKNFVRRN